MYVCRNCGWEYSGKYCPRCGTELVDETESGISDVTLSSSVSDEDRVAEARKNLWLGMHSDHIDTTKCIEYAEELKKYAPNDYYADFVQIALTEDDRTISRFLNSSEDSDIEMYAAEVLDFVCTHMTAGLYRAVVRYKSRSHLRDSSKYEFEIESHAPYSVKKKNERAERAEERKTRIPQYVSYEVKQDRAVTKKLAVLYSVFVVISGVGLLLGFLIPTPTAGYVFLPIGCVFTLTNIIIIIFCHHKMARIITAVMIAIFAGISIATGVLFLPGGLGTDRDWDGFTYKLSYNYCVVTGYTGSSKDVYIPSEYDGKTVYAIGDSAFSYNTITSVSIPESIKKMGEFCFADCFSLESVTFGGGIKKISYWAFWGCRPLSKIDLVGVKKIGEDAFGCCFGLKSVTLHDSLRKIDKYGFKGCIALETITIPATVRTIGKEAFQGAKLTSANFEDPNGWRAGGKSIAGLDSTKTAASLLVNGIDGKYKVWHNH